MIEALKATGQGASRFLHGFAMAATVLGCLVLLVSLAAWAIPALGGPALPSPARMFQSGLMLIVVSGVLHLLLRGRR